MKTSKIIKAKDCPHFKPYRYNSKTHKGIKGTCSEMSDMIGYHSTTYCYGSCRKDEKPIRTIDKTNISNFINKPILCSYGDSLGRTKHIQYGWIGVLKIINWYNEDKKEVDNCGLILEDCTTLINEGELIPINECDYDVEYLSDGQLEINIPTQGQLNAWQKRINKYKIMEKEMYKYPSIGLFKNLVKEIQLKNDYKGRDENDDPIYEHTTPYPKLRFRGTIKCHGTNSAIVKYKDNTYQFQSRERILSLEEDNAGFMNFMSSNPGVVKIFDGIEFDESVIIYGEWCGGNIQKGVALNQTGIYDEPNRIFNITQFPQFGIEIDFEHPELSQDELTRLTISVEDECPVGKYFGISGVGEGIVWTCTTDPSIKFKSKGEKHSVSKTAKPNAVNDEVIKGINDFVELAVTENRLKQGLDFLKESNLENDVKNLGTFIKWVVGDVIKEESDTIKNNSLDEKLLNKSISLKARNWFLNQ